jgi:hypothetical protein
MTSSNRVAKGEKLKKKAILGALLGALTLAAVAYAADNKFNQVKPSTYDPAKTYLVSSGWHNGIGCPTNAGISTTGGKKPDTTYTDPACTTGDSKDKKNQGLLLAKTGPTGNYAAAQAELKDVKGMTLNELGYDIRKPTSSTDPRGSHCGAGAPRFNIDTTDGNSYFLGCNSPPATSQTAGNGWVRLRWSPVMAYNASTGMLENISGKTVQDISIVFDEGQDTGPDNFGLAVLDNIDVNGVLVGQGDHGDDD